MYHGQHSSQREELNPAHHLPQQSHIHATMQPMLPSGTSGQPSTVQHYELGEYNSLFQIGPVEIENTV